MDLVGENGTVFHMNSESRSREIGRGREFMCEDPTVSRHQVFIELSEDNNNDQNPRVYVEVLGANPIMIVKSGENLKSLLKKGESVNLFEGDQFSLSIKHPLFFTLRKNINDEKKVDKKINDDMKNVEDIKNDEDKKNNDEMKNVEDDKKANDEKKNAKKVKFEKKGVEDIMENDEVMKDVGDIKKNDDEMKDVKKNDDEKNDVEDVKREDTGVENDEDKSIEAAVARRQRRAHERKNRENLKKLNVKSEENEFGIRDGSKAEIVDDRKGFGKNVDDSSVAVKMDLDVENEQHKADVHKAENDEKIVSHNVGDEDSEKEIDKNVEDSNVVLDMDLDVESDEHRGDDDHGETLLKEFGVGLLELESVDPVSEFGFLVEGREFERYGKRGMGKLDLSSWLADDNNQDSEADSDEDTNGTAKKAKGRKSRKTKAEDDDEEWTGESEEEKDLLKKSSKINTSKTRPRLRKNSGVNAPESKSRVKKSANKKSGSKKDVNTSLDDDIDEADETVGGFIVDDVGATSEEEDGEEEEEEWTDDDSDDDEE